MLNLSVRHNFADVRRQIEQTGKQGRFAAARALSATARSVKSAEQKEIARVFDRPTPYARNAVYQRNATSATLTAEVWLKGIYAGAGYSFLLPQIEGGKRLPKRFEFMLRAHGILPAGMFAVPGEGAKLDAYGNMSAGQIVQILSQLRVQLVGGFESKIGGRLFDRKKVDRAVKRQGYRIFAVTERRGRLPPGVYARYQFAHGSAIKPLLIFVRAPHYQVRFRFFDVARATFEREFPPHFDGALREVTSGGQYGRLVTR